MAKFQGFCFYEGPSVIDGSPIVGIVTGLKRPSQNTKTGEMLQLWIIRSDMHPADAIKANEDFAICGDCFHRGDASRKRSCYVPVEKAPSSVYRAYKNGRYPLIDASWAATLVASHSVRVGAYGDPCAIPFEAYSWLPSSVTGYTHQWKHCDIRFASFLMASVDSLAERILAKSLGFRTFRVRPAGSFKAIHSGERVCPASDEARERATSETSVTCKRCMGCGGNDKGRDTERDYVIIAHGNGRVNIA